MSADYAITLPFSFNAYGGVSNTADAKKIWQDRVVLVVMTLTGERVMRPDHGTLARASVFENYDDAAALIKEQVNYGFSKWLPELTLTDVAVSVDPLEGNLVVSIDYTYGNGEPNSVIIRTAYRDSSGNIITEA